MSFGLSTSKPARDIRKRVLRLGLVCDGRIISLSLSSISWSLEDVLGFSVDLAVGFSNLKYAFEAHFSID